MPIVTKAESSSEIARLNESKQLNQMFERRTNADRQLELTCAEPYTAGQRLRVILPVPEEPAPGTQAQPARATSAPKQ